MTKEEEHLLLIELCEKLPYGVIVDNPNPAGGAWDEVINIDTSLKTVTLLYDGRVFSINDVKPYLRPLSSMTEEEWKDFSVFIGKTETYVQQIRLDADSMANPIIGGYQCVYWGLFDKCIDWLNKNMFDYRGLIQNGLALEAQKGMYKI